MWSIRYTPQANSHPPWLFSGLWVPLCFKQVPGGLVFITAYGGRSDHAQLSTENSLDRHWKGNTFMFSFFLVHLFGTGTKKKPGFCHLPVLQCHYLLNSQQCFLQISFPYHNMNLPTQNILRFCSKTIINTVKDNRESPLVSKIHRLTIKGRDQVSHFYSHPCTSRRSRHDECYLNSCWWICSFNWSLLKFCYFPKTASSWERAHSNDQII